MRTALLSLAVAAATCLSAAPTKAEPILGSGSTFAYPIIAAWSDAWLRSQADGNDFVADDRGVDFEPIGSLAGTMRLAQPEVDFAASDVPLPPDDLKKLGLQQFPLVMGGIAVITNLTGLPAGALKLDGAVLARIYLGEITNWSANEIKALNPDLPLPDQRIRVITRADGSGTTYNLTSFLASSNAEWRQGFGADTEIAWPTGVSVRGTGGMISTVQHTTGAIGYAEQGQAAKAGIAAAAIRNEAGRYVTPSPASLQAAAASADWSKAPEFNLMLVGAPAADAYPLAATTFVLLRRSPHSANRTARVHRFIEFALEHGDAAAEALGYVPLPQPLAVEVRRRLSDAPQG